MKKHLSIGRQIALHLTPGVLGVALFVLLSKLLSPRLPSLLLLYLSLIPVLLAELGIILLFAARQPGQNSIAGVIRFTTSIPWWQLILFSILSIGWVALVYLSIGDVLNRFVLTTFFDWLPGYFQLNGFFDNPGQYSRGLRIFLWLLILIFGSLLGPFVEELYFHGLLLPRMGYLKAWAPLVGSILFAVYHFWSPWLIPIRLLALLPMVYFVWWKKNLYIAVIAHCTLNLLSDALFTIPLFFSP